MQFFLLTARAPKVTFCSRVGNRKSVPESDSCKIKVSVLSINSCVRIFVFLSSNLNLLYRLDTFGWVQDLPSQQQFWSRRRRVLREWCIEGDNAFGFSGMEVETTCRYKLPVVIIVINNNGIYSGVDPKTWKEMEKMGDMTTIAPPVTLLPEARYEQVMSAFGGRGYLVRTEEELRSALQESLNNTQMPSLRPQTTGVSLADTFKSLELRRISV